ncbi:MAG: hypothetical protein ACO3PV_02940 [Pseudohongiellaceae bacterium]
MKALRFLGLLLALGVSPVALADRWDTLGSRHSPDVVRYGYVHHHARRDHAWGWQRQRNEINIIVAPLAPIGHWAPRWNGRQDWRQDWRRDWQRNTYVFNSGLGFIAGALAGLATAPQLAGSQPYYTPRYRAPTRVIRRAGGGMSISLYKDLNGACYERETDHDGRVTKRRLADYNCDF